MTRHQDVGIPAIAPLIDLDSIATNPQLGAFEASRLGLNSYTMTKQYARNLMVTAVAQANALGPAVAVAVQCGQFADRYGIPIGQRPSIGYMPGADHRLPRRHCTRCGVVDPAVVGFRTQMQMNRTFVVPVSGVRSGRPQVEGVFDVGVNMLDEDANLVPLAGSVARARDGATRYTPCGVCS